MKINYLIIWLCCLAVLTGCNSKRDEVVSIIFQIEDSQTTLQGSVNGVQIAGESGVVVIVSDKEALKILMEKNLNSFFDITVKGETYSDVTFDEVITDGEFLIMDAVRSKAPTLELKVNGIKGKDSYPENS